MEKNMQDLTAENMPEELISTQRACEGEITNKWGATIENVHLWHRKGLKGNSKDWIFKEIKKDKTVKLPYSIPYCTGCGRHDYWYLEWNDAAGHLWKVRKGDFYCDLRAEDEGSLVTFTIKGGTPGTDDEVDVDMSSGRCWVGIK